MCTIQIPVPPVKSHSYFSSIESLDVVELKSMQLNERELAFLRVRSVVSDGSVLDGRVFSRHEVPLSVPRPLFVPPAADGGVAGVNGRVTLFEGTAGPLGYFLCARRRAVEAKRE